MPFDLNAKFGPEVTVLRLEVREQTLSFLRPLDGHEDMKGPRKLGKHDYIIFTAIARNHRPFSFVVEKIRKWTDCGGIPSHIHMVPLSEHSSAALPSSSRFVRELQNHWIVSTTELNTILTTTGHRYNLFSANCWSYATNIVENMLGLCLCHSLRMSDFKTVRGCVEALQQLEKVKRPLPRDVFYFYFRPALSPKKLDTARRIANWRNRRSVKLVSSCAENPDTNCDTIEAVLNLCLLHSRISDTNCDTVEVVLYLCLRHSLRMDDLELARGCEEALQQLVTVKRPMLRDVLRLVYKPLSHQNPDTVRKIINWWNRSPVELASSCASNCDTVEAVLHLRLRSSQRMQDLELARDCEEALQQLGTVKHPLLLDVLIFLCLFNKLFTGLSTGVTGLFTGLFIPQVLGTVRKILNLQNRRSVKLASSCARNCDTVEAVLYLFLRHSLRMHDLELARGCETALQQLETVKRPLPREVLRLVYKPLSHQNPDTLRSLRRPAVGGIVFQLNRPAPEIVTQMYTEV